MGHFPSQQNFYCVSLRADSCFTPVYPCVTPVYPCVLPKYEGYVRVQCRTIVLSCFLADKLHDFPMALGQM